MSCPSTRACTDLRERQDCTKKTTSLIMGMIIPVYSSPGEMMAQEKEEERVNSVVVNAAEP